MGNPRGFLDHDRSVAPARPADERICDYSEFVGPRSPEAIAAQAGRCMDCGIPFCHQGCPLGNDIPQWNAQVAAGDWRGAYDALRATNDFPEFTGRICPAPCETSCVLAIDGAAVTIEQNEKEIIERAFAEGWVIAEPPTERTGKTVGIVGSGPAGLAAARQLNHAGHTVTVYERDGRIGGLLRFGIPDFKLERTVVDRRVKLMHAEGILFKTGVTVGETVTWADLRERHDAVLMAVGAQRPRDMDLPGRQLKGVHQAMDYLVQQNRVIAGIGTKTDRIDARGKHVVILGGGDTGSDCHGTAQRQGAASVTSIGWRAAPPDERLPDNPWPQWPMILRTSSSHEEGGRRQYGFLTTQFVGNDAGSVVALEGLEVAERAAGGRVISEGVPGSEHTVRADLVLLAVGFTGVEPTGAADAFGLTLTTRGTIAVGADFQTSADGVFAAGDATRGASLVVWAISDGREAARGIDTWLRKGASALPTRGIDASFERA